MNHGRSQRSHRTHQHIHPSNRPSHRIVLLTHPRQLIRATSHPRDIGQGRQHNDPKTTVSRHTSQVIVSTLPTSSTFHTIIISSPHVDSQSPTNPNSRDRLYHSTVRLGRVINIRRLSPTPPNDLSTPITHHITPPNSSHTKQ